MSHLINDKASFSNFHDESDVYRDDFNKIVKQREKIRIPYLHASPQLSFRHSLVNYLRKLCQAKNFSHCCLHLAVYLTDLFMDSHYIKQEKLLMLANVCLLIAAKFEENSSDIPKIFELNLLLPKSYSVTEYKSWEVVVLDFFSWYVRFPTAAHYTHYYLKAALTQEDIDHTSIKSYYTLFYQIHHHVLNYLNEVLNNEHYMHDFKPSQVAAGIIAASRIQCGLPAWTSKLQSYTSYTLEDIRESLFSLYVNKTACVINQS